MNLDDPKLTAYALGELDEPERAEMEARLREDPAAAAEVAALREFTARLRTELHDEKAPGLTEDQRAGVFAAARGDAAEPSAGGGAGAAVVEREESSGPVTNHFRTWLAMAAVAAAAATMAIFWFRNDAEKRYLASNEAAKTAEVRLTSPPLAQLEQKVSVDAPIRPTPVIGKDATQLASTPTSAATPFAGAMSSPSKLTAEAATAQPAQATEVAENEKLAFGSDAGVPPAMPSIQSLASTASASEVAKPIEDKGEFTSRYALAETNETRSSGGRGMRSFAARGAVAFQEKSAAADEGKAAAPTDRSRLADLADAPTKGALGVRNEKSFDAPLPASPAPNPDETLKRQVSGDQRMAAAAKDATPAAPGAGPADSDKLAMFKEEAAPMTAAPAAAAPAAGPAESLGRPVAPPLAGGGAGQPEAKQNEFIAVSTQRFAAIPIVNPPNSADLAGAVRDDASSADGTINTYAYRGQKAKSPDPIAVALEVAACPWEPEHRLLRVSLAARSGTSASPASKASADTKGNLDALSPLAAEAPSPKNVKLQIEFNPAQAQAYRLVSTKEAPAEPLEPGVAPTVVLKRGEAVTALYEIIPATPPADALEAQVAYAGKRTLNQTRSDRAKEETVARKETEPKPASAKPGEPAGRANELLTLDLAWTDPESGGRQTRSFPLSDSGRTLPESSPEFRWSAAQATFGLLLQNSPEKGSMTWSEALKFGEDAKGKDANGQRQKFLDQMQKASASPVPAKPK